MQTTLRVDDEIYRQAKAEAAREGITLTKFIEEALELRLRQVPAPATPGELPVFRGGPPLPPRSSRGSRGTRSVPRTPDNSHSVCAARKLYA